jgi:hypothetical protein
VADHANRPPLPHNKYSGYPHHRQETLDVYPYLNEKRCPE